VRSAPVRGAGVLGLVAGASALVLGAQAVASMTLTLGAQSKPPASRTHLDGTWQLEDSIAPENPKNWQRPVPPLSMDPRLEPCIEPSPQRTPVEVAKTARGC